MSANNSHGVVVPPNGWKVFGGRANEAMEATRRESLSKAEILERYGAVVGVRDVSIRVG